MRHVFVPPTASEPSDGPFVNDELFVRLVRLPKHFPLPSPLPQTTLLSMLDRFMAPGYVTADQIREGDRFEVSNGRRLELCPAGGRGGRANLVGASVLDTDPDVKSAAIDTGFAPNRKTLRAPDIAVGNIPDAPGWVRGTPPLAVEYADTGQDEVQLQKKIKELFAASTEHIWVVRLDEPRRVEIHQPGKSMRVVYTGALSAPGILRNPVPVAALYDREAAHAATLRNLLQRRGYASLEEVEEKARKKGRREGTKKGRERGLKKGREEGQQVGRLEGQRQTVLRILTARFGELPHDAILCVEHADPEHLDVITEKLVTAPTLSAALAK